MLSDDLVRRVALDALGPAVPRCDVACRIEQEDSVVDDALDEEPVVFEGRQRELLLRRRAVRWRGHRSPAGDRSAVAMRARLATTATSSAGSIGFGTCMEKPAMSERLRSSALT